MRHLLYIFIFSTILAASFGCSSEPKMSTVETDSTEIPNMVTFDVNMLISDSGVIKYKALSPVWYVYENDIKNKYWYFPEGIRLDQIDTTFSTEFSIEADTAYNYETKQIWHLIKNVKVHSTSGEYFETNDLYWDLRKHVVYSDSFIHIERPDAIIEGYGFTSDDAFTKYEIRQTSGIFPFQDNAPVRNTELTDSIVDSATETIANQTNGLANQEPVISRSTTDHKQSNPTKHPNFNIKEPELKKDEIIKPNNE